MAVYPGLQIQLAFKRKGCSYGHSDCALSLKSDDMALT